MILKQDEMTREPDGVLDKLVRAARARGDWLAHALDDSALRSGLEGLLSAVRDHAKRDGRAREWKALRRRITEPAAAEDCSYRRQVAALFEAAVLGVAVCQWPQHVRLWPSAGSSRKLCELHVHLPDLEFWGEAKAMWRDDDRNPKQHGCRPRLATLDDEVTRLVSTVREAAIQLPAGGPNVCFALHRHSQYPGLYPLGEGTKEEVYGRMAEELRCNTNVGVDAVAVFHEWNPPDWIVLPGGLYLQAIGLALMVPVMVVLGTSTPRSPGKRGSRGIGDGDWGLGVGVSAGRETFTAALKTLPPAGEGVCPAIRAASGESDKRKNRVNMASSGLH